VTRTLTVLLLALAACAWPSSALAGRDQEMILQDDPKVVHAGSDAELKETLERIKALGTDRLRVTVFWHLLAPGARRERRPDFGERGASDPRSYHQEAWRRYDRIVYFADKLDLELMFTVSGPGPAWADKTRRGRAGIVRPDAGAFRDFVEAVGQRYSGEWPVDPTKEPPATPLPGSSSASPPAKRLPRVDHWSVWNEPNFPGWLMPQWRGRRPVSPHLYRGLVDAAWDGLVESGHSDDTVLLGETARFARSRRLPLPGSLVDTLRFVRELYCVSTRYRPLRGRSARARGCPANSPARRRFPADHPGLFEARGWAHHPYTIFAPPDWPGRVKTDTTLRSVNRIGRSLDRAQRAWHRLRRLPLWVTEYGYQTRPDPFRGVPLSRQATWMSWSEFVAFRNPRVASFAQFLLNDDAPVPHRSRRRHAAWITWQSGLRNNAGRAKPALEEYRRPIFVSPRRPRGRRVRVFGSFRPAAPYAQVPAQIEFREAGGDWRTLRALTAGGSRGYIDARVRVPGAGRVRIAFLPPGGEQVNTRGVFVAPR
jgi:hypothetical protein